MSEMIRLLLVEDQQLVRGVLVNFLQQDDAVEVIAEASGGEQALDLALRHKPDIVVMNITLPDMCGIDAAIRIRKQLPDTGVVVVTSRALDIFHRAMRTLRQAGVQGFISKDAEPADLLAAVHSVYNRREFVSNDIMQYHLSSGKGNDVSVTLNALTDREFITLLLIMKGKRNKEMSVLMFISQKTVSTYRKRVYKKLDVDNDVQLIQWALLHNLVQLQYP